MVLKNDILIQNTLFCPLSPRIIVLCRLGHLYKVFILITIMAMVIQLKFGPQIRDILDSICSWQVDCWFSYSNEEISRTLCSPVQNNSSRRPSRIFAERMASPFHLLLALYRRPADMLMWLEFSGGKVPFGPRACEMVRKVVEH